MKKTILTTAIALVAIFGFSSMAQQPQSGEKTCTSATCPKDSVNKKQARKLFNPYNEVFAGLNLTPEQQAKVNQLEANRQAQLKARRGMKAKSRQEADSIMRADRTQQERAYLDAVKQVLTPDQYVLFLEELVVNAPQQQGRPGMGMDRGRRDKANFNGQRPGKGEKARFDGQRPGKNFKGQRPEGRGQKTNASLSK